MIDRAQVARILHYQWIELLEEERDSLPTIDHRVTIGTSSDDIWMEIDSSGDASWDPESLGVPPVLGVIELGPGDSACRIVSGKEIVGTFSQFVCEVIVALSRSLPPSDAVRAAIQELRSQLAGIREPMTKEKQRGLVGELGILATAISELGDAALETWVGPTDTYESLHDFAGSKLHIEAKSTNTNPPVVQINEIAQLDWRGEVPLVLGVSHVIEHEEGANLHDHVSEAASMLGSNSSRIRLLNLCRFVGYNPDHMYTTLHRVNSVRWFVIDADSPIVQPELLTKIPSSVLSFKYDLFANDLQETPGIHWGDLLG